MKLAALIIAALCLLATSGGAQTVKAVAFNTTNNTVVSTNRIIFTLLGTAGGSAATPAFAIAVGTNTVGLFALSQLGIGPYLGFSVNGNRSFYISTNTIRAELPISFSSTTNSAETRTNLGLGLPALTNTSNVTTMRALAGSTNTNQPFSGSVVILDFNEDSHNVTISNGIILNWQAP
jgi:hypothetical protein